MSIHSKNCGKPNKVGGRSTGGRSSYVDYKKLSDENRTVLWDDIWDFSLYPVSRVRRTIKRYKLVGGEE